jgi:hypothetical protein
MHIVARYEKNAQQSGDLVNKHFLKAGFVHQVMPSEFLTKTKIVEK